MKGVIQIREGIRYCHVAFWNTSNVKDAYIDYICLLGIGRKLRSYVRPTSEKFFMYNIAVS